MEPVVVVRIHPGQLDSISPFLRSLARLGERASGLPTSIVLRSATALAWLSVCWATPLVGEESPVWAPQSAVVREPDEPPSPDASESVRRALAAQARFERRRVRHFPAGFGGWGGDCAHRVGRFCTWYDSGEWYPKPEAPEIVRMRAELLAVLDSVQADLPADDRVRGLRVWYLTEAGRHADALGAADGCAAENERRRGSSGIVLAAASDAEDDGLGSGAWFCSALRGFSLHRSGDYLAAEQAFELALALMDPERARTWRVPFRVVAPSVRRMLEDAADSADSDSLDMLLERLWTLADPLALASGNDRLTAHYARWTAAAIRRGTRTSFGLSWGGDLEELTVRNGWPSGWERNDVYGSIGSGATRVVSHKHPEGRDYMPPAAALAEPWSATREELAFDLTEPRSLYAPTYAPLLLPMDAQIAFLPRKEDFVVAAAYFLPPDTTRHAPHDHPKIWLDPGEQAGHPDRAGLFAIPMNGASTEEGSRAANVISSLAFGRPAGALAISVPSGRYLISVEAWSPGTRRAGVLRRGYEYEAGDDETLTVSDLLLLARDDSGRGSAPLAELLPRMLPRAEVERSSGVTMAWEMRTPPGRRPFLKIAVSARRLDRGVWRRIGEFLRIVGPRGEPLAVSWEEEGPESGDDPRLRTLDLDFSGFEPGLYEISLEVSANGAPGENAVRTVLVR